MVENEYYREVTKLRKTIEVWDEMFTCEVAEDERMQAWIRLEVMGDSLVNKYAWAVPDSRAINILKTFSPLIEIGAGIGYWSKLLLESDVDIISFDSAPPAKEEAWAPVQKGDPKVLKKSSSKGRNLFLCYPDEGEGMALECLENFTGEYIIHVGELINSGTLSLPQSAWGRTSAPDFQVKLNAEFHCVLNAQLSASFPFSRDCISVWKRTEFVRGKGGGEEEEEEEEVGVEDEKGDAWACIPLEERIPVDRAAPLYQHLI